MNLTLPMTSTWLFSRTNWALLFSQRDPVSEDVMPFGIPSSIWGCSFGMFWRSDQAENITWTCYLEAIDEQMHGSVKSNNKSPVFWWFVPPTPGKCRVVYYCFTNSCIQIHQNSSTEVKPQPVSPPSWPVAAWYSGHASALPAYKPPPRGGWYTVQHLQLDHRIAAVGVLKRQMCWNVSGDRDAGQKACPWLK